MAAAVADSLQPLRRLPLRVGSVRPQGWLARELRLQADGLSGAFFTDVWGPTNNSQWIGGSDSFQNWQDLFP